MSMENSHQTGSAGKSVLNGSPLDADSLHKSVLNGSPLDADSLHIFGAPHFFLQYLP